jgi:hypothetical protein
MVGVVVLKKLTTFLTTEKDHAEKMANAAHEQLGKSQWLYWTGRKQVCQEALAKLTANMILEASVATSASKQNNPG